MEWNDEQYAKFHLALVDLKDSFEEENILNIIGEPSLELTIDLEALDYFLLIIKLIQGMEELIGSYLDRN